MGISFRFIITLSRRYRWLLTICLVSLVYFFAFGRSAYQPKVFNLDFVAFYCAGETANSGSDPYLTEPLRTCEHRVGASFRKGSVLVLPAPLPAYDIGFFRIFSRLPFAFASAIWCVFGVFVVALCILLVARGSGLPCSIPFASMGLSLGYVSISLGQIAPFSLFGLLLVAESIAMPSFVLAFCGTALACFEPHLALPGLIAAFLFGPMRSRLGVFIGCCSLAVVSFLSVSTYEIIEYFRFVLPAHALSEINNHEQFSFAYYLHTFLGFGERSAVHISEISYGFLVVFGVAISKRLSDRYGSRMLVMGPTTLGLVAGPFLHVTQIAAAVPSALYGWSRDKGGWFGWGVLALAVPWIQFAPIVVVAPLAIAAFVYLSTMLCRMRPTFSFVVSFIGVLGCVLSAYTLGSAVRHFHVVSHATASGLAEVSWREAVDLADVGNNFVFSVAKTPGHAGVLIVALVLVFSTVRRSSLVRSGSL